MLTLKLLGALGAIAAAALVFEKHFEKNFGRSFAKSFEKNNDWRRSELETVASVELRKILLYAAPPTFLAPVSSVEEHPEPLRWLGKTAGR
jgi:hypothetical protein